MARKERPTTPPKGLSPERLKLWEALQATSKAFEDVPVEELEREVTKAIAEDRAERRACPARDRKDPFAIIDELREAFKDVPPEEIEAEVARAIREGREQSRRPQPPAPRRA